MDLIQRFGEYAAAFERVYQSDDWSQLEPYFTEDAVYAIEGGPPFGGRVEGRKALIEHLHRSVDAFDRRFPSRRLQLLEGPMLRNERVWMRWRVSYSGPGIPELVLDGEESASFEGDQIRLLEDRFPPEAGPITEMWLRSFAKLLAPARTSG
jgi:SnoaL-like protein